MERQREIVRDLIYAGVNLPLAIMHAPTVAILPALYAKQAGLSLVVIGSILMAMRIFDSVIDPMIGFLSDRTRSRFGRRKPWILAGTIVAGFGSVIAFHPTATTGYVYFAVAYFLLVVGWSLVEIPHTAWLNELTGEYQARSRIATYRYVAGLLGSACFLVIPLLPFFPTTEMTPDVTAAGSWMVVALLVIMVAPALVIVPDHQLVVASQQFSLRQVLHSVSGNRPFWFFAAMQSLSGVSSGIVGGLFFFYLGSYLDIADKYSYIMLPVYAFSVIGAFFWLRATMHVDKHRIVAACSLVTAATNLAMFYIQPGEGALAAMITIFAISAFSGAGSTSAYASLLADVVDYGTLKTGSNYSGNYFAAWAFINKCCLAVGGGLGLTIAGLFGYTAQGPNGPLEMMGFFVAIVWIPCLLNVGAALIAWRFPITRKRQAAIRQELDERTRNEELLMSAGRGDAL
jgi:glycoside/pentoside/hexuronide:cation symporter, GPH family